MTKKYTITANRINSKHMLKVAVGLFNGKLVVLEDFPNDEAHAGLHEMTNELEYGEYNVEAGIYLVDVAVVTESNSMGPDPDDSTYLEIVDWIKVGS